MNISILTPTRNRPHLIKSMTESAFQTANDPDNIEVCFYIDEDDNVSEEVIRNLFQFNVKFKRGRRIILGDTWNKALELANADILMHNNDDIIFRSQGWDKAILEAFETYEDKIVFVYSNNGNPNQKSGTHGFLHKNWVDVVGYFTPPYFSSDNCDSWLNEVAWALDRSIFLPDVLIEHMHYTLGKSEMDSTYAERIANGTRDNCGQIYIDKAPERKNNIKKLQEFITNFGGKL